MMSFQNISNIELISRMEKLVRTERKITHLILQCIFEIEERKLYVEMGYDGMYSYLTRGLGYSEASAYRRLQAARLLKQVPEVSEKVQEGTLNLSQLAKVQKCLKQQNQKTGLILKATETLQVLEKIQNKNSFETERILASEFDEPIQAQEKIKPQKDNSIRLEITLTEEQFSELEQAKSLLSHLCPDGSWSDIIGTLAKIYNTKKLKGSESNLSLSLCSISSIHLTQSTTDRSFNTDVGVNAKVDADTDTEVKNKPMPALKIQTPQFSFLEKRFSKRPRQYISVKTRRLLLEKAQYCCEYCDPCTGKRCASKYQLEFDHVQPWSMGGSNESENLRVLCKKHNNLMAAKVGLKFNGKQYLSKSN